MLVDVKVPVLSESVAEATLLSWHRKEGEHVDRDENLIDIETDKIVMELPAPAAGILTKIVKGDGAIVAGGEIIATIDTEATPAETKAVPGDTAAAPLSAKPAPEPEGTSAVAASASMATMMPAARNMAAQAALDVGEISSIKGSGRDGRITKEDVAAHVEKKSSPFSAPSPAAPEPSATPTPLATTTPSAPMGNRPEQRVAMSRLRARIAERLVQSQSTAAILTTFNEVNMQAIMDLRARYKVSFEKEHGIKLGLMSFFVKAAVAALKNFLSSTHLWMEMTSSITGITT